MSSDSEMQDEFGAYVEEVILRLVRAIDRETELFLIMAESSRVEKLSENDQITLRLALRGSMSLTLFGKNVSEITRYNPGNIGKMEALRYLSTTLNSVEKITHEIIEYGKDEACRFH